MVGELRGLNIKPALLRVQFSVGLFHYLAGSEGVHAKEGGRAVFPVGRAAEHEEADGKDGLGPERERIPVVNSHIAVHLKGEGLGYRLPSHMDIVIQPALLDIFKFIRLGEGPDRLAGKVKERLDAKHEIEARGGMKAQIFYEDIVSCHLSSPYHICL